MIAALAAAALATAPPPPIVNGEVTSEQPAAGALMAVYDGYGMLACSGTLVDESWVLTAAHCVEAIFWVWDKGWDLYFVVGDEIFSGDDVEAYALVDYAAYHPDYDTEYLLYDLGVLHLAEPITSVDPLPMATDEVGQSWVGESFRFFGYGATSSALAGAGTKRVVDLEVTEIWDTYYLTYDDDGRNLCSGDSGGPALREGADGWEVVGVNSFVWADAHGVLCDDGGAGVARLDVGMDWLESELAVETPAGDGETSGTSEDGGPDSADDDPDPAETPSGGGGYLPADEPYGCGQASTVAPVALGWLFSLGWLVGRRRSP